MTPEQKKRDRFLQRRSAITNTIDISKEEFERIWVLADSGRCEICNAPRGIRRLHIDHDHETNKFRGILCGLCNKGLGSFRDDCRLLLRAYSYLLNSGPYAPSPDQEKAGIYAN